MAATGVAGKLSFAAKTWVFDKFGLEFWKVVSFWFRIYLIKLPENWVFWEKSWVLGKKLAEFWNFSSFGRAEFLRKCPKKAWFSLKFRSLLTCQWWKLYLDGQMGAWRSLCFKLGSPLLSTMSSSMAPTLSFEVGSQESQAVRQQSSSHVFVRRRTILWRHGIK